MLDISYYYNSGLIQLVIMALIFLIISIILAVFSPLGIGFIIFSIIRGKTSNPSLRTVSLVFQIILSVLTFLIGLIIAVLFLVKGSGIYLYSGNWIATVAVMLGMCFVVAIEIGIIVWESFWLKKREE